MNRRYLQHDVHSDGQPGARAGGSIASRGCAPAIAVACAAACALFMFAATASAQTVADIARRGACSTAGVEGISSQLVNTQICMRPTIFVRAAPHTNVTITSSRIHPLMSAMARDALWSAARSLNIQINSMFRPVSEQYVLYHSGGCGLAAAPGSSNHQSGRAVDVGNWSAARSALTGAGCVWLGSSDTVHFDCPGPDYRPDSIRAFQRLWNVNHPTDRIAEDGAYGPMTDSRLARSPASGFAMSGCVTMPPMMDAGTRPDTGVADSGPRPDGGAGDAGRMDGGGAGDRDGDGVPDVDDNCADTPNPDQIDMDNDGIGDACDPVDDRDDGPDGGGMMNPDPTAGDLDAARDGRVGSESGGPSMPGCGCRVAGAARSPSRGGTRAALVTCVLAACAMALRRRERRRSLSYDSKLC